MDGTAIAKVLGLTSSGIFAADVISSAHRHTRARLANLRYNQADGHVFMFPGYTWALSHAAVPAILFASEDLQAKQWRYQYLMGYYISRPMCIVNGLSFGYLAYQATESSFLRTLYILAAVTSASGVPYALTFLRRTNGALSRKAHRLAGPGPNNGQVMALRYAFDERRSVDRDQRMGTAETIERWSWHNYVRTWVLVLGTIVGAMAVALDGK
ncbi:hypothetical protein G647_02927 [Cladophialophora carrionii CBS 160.54]|uniref:DUF1772 domain-containing protein n=1 Tax=Cladophialophora carrionii CBS 160.54 TaxID=1279043 RepID=V9DH22_9EURO|nr:uncharacterized protein G647_02927 [Cladophialophora carrionii CBS 160.54]ETI26150.1 hypothetical protein G647_02927 [Cladophialophora carrionii CBS 160.54]